jgi:hypothetical protein
MPGRPSLRDEARRRPITISAREVTACIGPGKLTSEAVATRAGFMPGPRLADATGEAVACRRFPVSP